MQPSTSSIVTREPATPLVRLTKKSDYKPLNLNSQTDGHGEKLTDDLMWNTNNQKLYWLQLIHYLLWSVILSVHFILIRSVNRVHIQAPHVAEYGISGEMRTIDLNLFTYHGFQVWNNVASFKWKVKGFMRWLSNEYIYIYMYSLKSLNRICLKFYLVKRIMIGRQVGMRKSLLDCYSLCGIKLQHFVQQING